MINAATNPATQAIAPATVVSHEVKIISISLKWIILALIGMAILMFATFWLLKKRNS
jgi:hypothetical protein